MLFHLPGMPILSSLQIEFDPFFKTKLKVPHKTFSDSPVWDGLLFLPQHLSYDFHFLFCVVVIPILS